MSVACATPVPAPHPFSAAELELAWADWSGYSPVLADVLLVLARTGLRWSEARAVTVSDVGAYEIAVSRTAGEGRPARALPPSRVRVVPLAPRVRPVLGRLAAGRDAEELLLTTAMGTPLRRVPVLRRLHWERTGQGRNLADLRHTAASLWLDEGVEPALVRDWLGSARPVA